MALRDGIWINDGGSELHLMIKGQTVEGFYITAATRPREGHRYPVAGFINGDLIGFVVSWQECNSLTSWCGRYTVADDGREYIRTVWHLGRLFEDAQNTVPNPVWSTFITNTCDYYYTAENAA